MIKILNFGRVVSTLIKIKQPRSYKITNILRMSNVATKASADIEFYGHWSESKPKFLNDMIIIRDFISAEEESNLLIEIEPNFKRLPYEYDHWDNAIHGFRETEKKKWLPHNQSILERVRKEAFKVDIMPYVHVLDLAENGVIKPHVDSIRYCGTTIVGISLLSDCVMRLVRNGQKEKLANGSPKVQDEKTNYLNQTEPVGSEMCYADVLLKRRSLYIMRDSARYDYTHEILSNENSKFREEHIKKDRRISIICRNEP